MLRLAALSLFAIHTAGAAGFFPLEPGNTWVYRGGARWFNATLTISVGLDPIIRSGQVYHRLTGYVEEPLYVRTDASGSLYYLDTETGQERLLTSFEPSEANWFEAPKRLCRQEGRALPKRVDYRGAAGSFSSVLAVQYRVIGCADVGIEEEQFAENIGMVRRTVTTIAGPVSFHLVYARAGAVTIAEQPGAAFRLSLRPAGEDRLIATLHLSNAGGSPIKLTFPSSQEYEVVLRDAEGNERWRWSDGRLFTQALVEKQAGELAYEVEVPLDELPPGPYTVEAWLTTVRGREFAASAPWGRL